MPQALDNTVALVTGASSGIGAATARALAHEGAAVALVARRRERLETLANTIRTDGGVALAIDADITDAHPARAAVAETVAELGRLDIVINNAGLMLLGPVADAPDDEWRRMLDINVNGMLHITRAALPHLTRAAADDPRRVADIVNISSTAGRVARGGAAVYSLTKSGINAFSESLRQELQPQRVRVGVIEPGTVDTELGDHVRAELRSAVEQQTKDMEKLSPVDIADAVVYVVSRPRRVAVNELLVRAADQTW
ncbi:MAG TPA: SDR family NAD(P)-dependent oxidoreductase [Baekduia sp.]|uniref:SDR family NAD(P)-dependent oxidoreductase n=1 Tax=Baekduia sp. TaxID=2600305 RepID=UPI002B82ADB5|nr:SDR family NAD(P)-dependent oxidoreductase [Baekduia sp.]HMJ32615.1 SDR family NAD(P)-dependent oxidoreductase [Baekduia sp.]